MEGIEKQEIPRSKRMLEIIEAINSKVNAFIRGIPAIT